MIYHILRFLLITVLLSACGTLLKPVDTHESSVANKTHARSAPITTSINQRSSSFLYLAARAAILNKQHTLARQFLSALVSRLNQSTQVEDQFSLIPRLQLTELLLQNKQAKPALSLLIPLLKHYPIQTKNSDNELKLYLLYARSLTSSNKTTEALDYLTKLLNQHAEFIQARYLQINLYTSIQKYQLAHIATNMAIKLHDTAHLRQLQADIYVREKKFQSALQSLRSMQQLLPESETPILLQSSLEIQQGHIKQAEKLLRKAIKNKPQAYNLKKALAHLLVESKQANKAIELYQQLSQSMPNNPETQSALGMLYYQQQQFKLAKKQFSLALKLQPKTSLYQFYLAASLEAMQQNQLARDNYLKINSASPLWQQTQLRITSMDARLKHYPVALERIQTLLNKFPDNSQAWSLLSTIYLAQEKFQLLLDKTQAGLTSKQVLPRLLLNRAIAFEHFKRYNDIESTLQQLIKDNPDDAEALNFLAYTYAEQGIKLNVAITYIQHALSIHPKDGYYMDSLAWVLYKQQKYKQALKAQQQALIIISDDAIMHEHLGDILWHLNRKNVAIKAWQKALSLKSKNSAALQHKIKWGL